MAGSGSSALASIALLGDDLKFGRDSGLPIRRGGNGDDDEVFDGRAESELAPSLSKTELICSLKAP
jgi:hypothetical protein